MTRSTRTPQPQATRQAIAYVRVSTPGQREEGVSLAAQRAKLAAWCEVMGYELVHTYADEGISGFSVDKRPGLQQAIADACTRGCVLVVYSLSRLARNTRETLELGERFAKAGADLVSLSENIDTTSAAGKMVFRMLAVLAEFERDQISERTKTALAYKKARQERVGMVPYGSQVGPQGTLVPCEEEQAVIATMTAYRNQGMTLRAIVQAAARAGLVCRAGTPFQLTQIARMLKENAA